MKKIYFLVVLLYLGTVVMAQRLNYKSLSMELQKMERELVPDKRVAVLNIELHDTLQPLIALSGESSLPEAKREIIRFLHEKKISFRDSVRLLPDSCLGDKIWALAKLSVSNMRSRPDHASELVSQVLMGTPMKVLDREDNWYRVQTPEYYIGWVDSAGLQRLNSQELQVWKKSNRYLFNHLSGYVYANPDLKSKTISDLVIGDLIEVEANGQEFIKVRFPDHRTGYVLKKECISFADWVKSSPTDQSIITIAKQMLGFPYLWGGVSSKAMDCSGLVKLSFYSQGVILARDASQQAHYGIPVDFTNISNLKSGDLLFFGSSTQKITHVGIYLGNGDFIHASGKVGIGSIVAGDPKYNPARKLVAASRVLNSLNSEGITRVINHPWYSATNN
jgi:SH3-like domain-containing protein